MKPPKQSHDIARKFERMSIHEIRRQVKSLRMADLTALSQETVSQRVGLLLHQYPFQQRSLVLSGLYRGRLNKPGEVYQSASNLWYPAPEHVGRPGRLNREGIPVFYASDAPITCLSEMRVGSGSTATILVARAKGAAFHKLNVHYIGIERANAPELTALKPVDLFRHAPNFREALGEGNYKKWLEIDDYFSDVFAAKVTHGHEHLYKPTIALAEILLKSPYLHALNYPSVELEGFGTNLCLTPERVDALFEPSEAWMLEFGDEDLHPSTGERMRRMQLVRRSHPIEADWIIRWRGPGEGLSDDDFRRFARRKILQLPSAPSPATPGR